MPTYTLASVLDQVTEIRAAILRNGEFIAGCKELAILCPEVPKQDRMIGIAQIAEWEDWVFEPLPNLTVRFSAKKLSPLLASAAPWLMNK